MAARKKCKWDQEDEGSSTYDSDCGHTFIFNDDGPTDNGFTFCPFCGGKLIEIARQIESEGE